MIYTDYPCCPDTEEFYLGKEKVKNQHHLGNETEIYIAVYKPLIVEKEVQQHTHLGPGTGQNKHSVFQLQSFHVKNFRFSPIQTPVISMFDFPACQVLV